MRNIFRTAVLGMSLAVCTLTSQAQLAGYVPLNLSAFTTNPVANPMASGTVYTFTVGTTGATCAPIYLGSIKNLGITVEAQATNTTSVVGMGWALFNDAASANWYTSVSNSTGTSFRYVTMTASTLLGQCTTNFDVSGYLWAMPLYMTNTSQMVSNLSAGYLIKPGF